jgi:hypothetical protein
MADILAESQYGEWDDFVCQAKGGTIFHASWYLLALTDDLHIRVLRDEEGRIEAGMATMPKRFLGTTRTSRPELVAYNGPLIRHSRREGRASKASDEKNTLVRLLAESPAMGMYDYNLPPEYTDLTPFIWNGFDTLVRYTYQIPPAPVEQWQDEMSKGHRKDLNRARKAMEELNGVIEINGSPAEFLDTVVHGAKGDPHSFRLGLEQFENWWRRMRERDAATMYLFRDGRGKAITATLAVHDWRCAYDIAGGTRAGGARTGPARYVKRLLIERMICDAHHRNVTFDFEGSIDPGVEPFFRGWGGICVPK